MPRREMDVEEKKSRASFSTEILDSSHSSLFSGDLVGIYSILRCFYSLFL